MWPIQDLHCSVLKLKYKECFRWLIKMLKINLGKRYAMRNMPCLQEYDKRHCKLFLPIYDKPPQKRVSFKPLDSIWFCSVRHCAGFKYRAWTTTMDKPIHKREHNDCQGLIKKSHGRCWLEWQISITKLSNAYLCKPKRVIILPCSENSHGALGGRGVTQQSINPANWP